MVKGNAAGNVNLDNTILNVSCELINIQVPDQYDAGAPLYDEAVVPSPKAAMSVHAPVLKTVVAVVGLAYLMI